eukprot:132012_1
MDPETVHTLYNKYPKEDIFNSINDVNMQKIVTNNIESKPKYVSTHKLTNMNVEEKHTNEEKPLHGNDDIKMNKKQQKQIKCIVECLDSLIDDDIKVNNSCDKKQENSDIYDVDIVVTNKKSEYFVPHIQKIESSSKNNDISTIYDVWTYCSTELKINNKHKEIMHSLNDFDEWKEYTKTFGLIELTPNILIADNIIGYHFFTIAMSHIIRTLDQYKPFQISMGIIAHKIENKNGSTVVVNKINITEALNKSSIKFKQKLLHGNSINGIMRNICDCIW